ncbi:MAG: hypothetical protein JO247_18685 [Chloroflexi bacterium]|nr:hypothetical protein [Chloroflexota bacterium]
MPLPGLSDDGAHVTYDPIAQTLYVTQPQLGLDVVDARTRQVVAKLPQLAGAGLTMFDHDFVYVATGPSQLSVVAKQGWQEAGSWSVTGTISGMWADVPADRLYALSSTGEVDVYAGGQAPRSVGSYRVQGAVSGAGTLVPEQHALLLGGGSSILALDTNSGQSRQLVSLSAVVTGLAMDQDTGYLWATTADHKVALLDLASGRMLGSLPAPSSAGVAIDQPMRSVYTFGDGSFGAYDANTNEYIAQVAAIDPSASVGAVDPVEHAIYLVDGKLGGLDVYEWGAASLPPPGLNIGGGTPNNAGGGGSAGAGVGGGLLATGGSSGASTAGGAASLGGGSASGASSGSSGGFGGSTSGASSSGGSTAGSGAFGSGSSSSGSSIGSGGIGSGGSGSGTTSGSFGSSGAGSGTSSSSLGGGSSGSSGSGAGTTPASFGGGNGTAGNSSTGSSSSGLGGSSNTDSTSGGTGSSANSGGAGSGSGSDTTSGSGHGISGASGNGSAPGGSGNGSSGASGLAGGLAGAAGGALGSR